MVLYILIVNFLERRREDKKTLNRMAASTPRIYSALNFFVNAVLVRYCCSQIFELYQNRCIHISEIAADGDFEYICEFLLKYVSYVEKCQHDNTNNI
jgi:hypothetical protein